MRFQAVQQSLLDAPDSLSFLSSLVRSKDFLVSSSEVCTYSPSIPGSRDVVRTQALGELVPEFGILGRIEVVFAAFGLLSLASADD